MYRFFHRAAFIRFHAVAIQERLHTAVILNEKILAEDGQDNISIRIFFKHEVFFEEKMNIFFMLG